jgi:hypothetical protein
MDINLGKQLNLFVYAMKDLKVDVTNDQQVKGIGSTHKVFVHIQGLEIQIGCYSLLLNAMDMVLGS